MTNCHAGMLSFFNSIHTIVAESSYPSYAVQFSERIITKSQSFDPENKPTFSAHPARFTPEDRYSRHRITLKSRFGILPSQGTPIVY
ncbi:unnamed protein product [Schistosoma bovis]|nr:unnamed protein product [Schistosoma bovis]CAH8482389.1 unnamed protein product [Schistosoma bovis]